MIVGATNDKGREFHVVTPHESPCEYFAHNQCLPFHSIQHIVGQFCGREYEIQRSIPLATYKTFQDNLEMVWKDVTRTYPNHYANDVAFRLHFDGRPLDLTLRTLHRLIDTSAWLDSDLVATYIQMVAHDESMATKEHDTVFLNSHIYSAIRDEEHTPYLRDASKKRLVSAKNIVVLIHENHHFKIAHVSKGVKYIYVYDSMTLGCVEKKEEITASIRRTIVIALHKYCGMARDEDVWRVRVAKPVGVDDIWSPHASHASCPQQPHDDGVSCGIFAMAIAECLMRGRDLFVIKNLDPIKFRKQVLWQLWYWQKHRRMYPIHETFWA